jgi:hypothetical protein
MIFSGGRQQLSPPAASICVSSPAPRLAIEKSASSGESIYDRNSRPRQHASGTNASVLEAAWHTLY